MPSICSRWLGSKPHSFRLTRKRKWEALQPPKHEIDLFPIIELAVESLAKVGPFLNTHIAAFVGRNTHLVTVDTHDFAFLPIWGVMEARHHPMFTGPCMHNGINEFVSSPLFGHGRRSTANPQTLRAVGISWSSDVVTVKAPPSRGVVLKTFTYECSYWGKGLPVLEVIDSGRRKAHASSVWRPGRGSETLLISLFIVFNLVLLLQHRTLSGTTNDTQIHSCKITYK